jgi:hypothetical protein
MTFLQKLNLESNEIVNFNGIYNVTGKNIYIFDDGNQESEKSFITIMISNTSNNIYKIELFNKKFLTDCDEADTILYGNIADNMLVANQNEKNIKNHKFYFNEKTLYYEYNSIYNNVDNYLEIGIFEGAKLDI